MTVLVACLRLAELFGSSISSARGYLGVLIMTYTSIGVVSAKLRVEVPRCRSFCNFRCKVLLSVQLNEEG